MIWTTGLCCQNNAQSHRGRFPWVPRHKKEAIRCVWVQRLGCGRLRYAADAWRGRRDWPLLVHTNRSRMLHQHKDIPDMDGPKPPFGQFAASEIICTAKTSVRECSRTYLARQFGIVSRCRKVPLCHRLNVNVCHSREITVGSCVLLGDIEQFGIDFFTVLTGQVLRCA